jgi:2-polyprenyl-3-methyl-5-hydroxy-6-metoxy-1,4-benzoquinol methylase
MGKLLDRATDPHQYDNNSDAGWDEYGIGLQSPTRANFWEYLKPLVFAWKGKNILEIGSGTGWLLELAIKLGAKAVLGMDPSEKNFNLGEKLYPDAKLLNITFEEFSSQEKYDFIIALLSLVNIRDMGVAFKKIGSLLKPSGEFVAIVPDFDYYKKKRFGYKITLEEINSDEYVAMVERPEITTTSIVRTSRKYAQFATQSGLTLIEDKPLPPTELLMQKMPRYREIAGIPMARLLRFKKTSSL